jgi:acylphosphatase
MMEGIKHFEVLVSGRVQGVGFRYAARNQARALSLKGWIKNQSDGSVLSAVQGDLESCQKYIQWCRGGTGYSWVERVEIKEKAVAEFKAFSVRY